MSNHSDTKTRKLAQQDLPSFDVMKRMAEENPEGLEQLRRQLAEDLINSAPQAYQRRLRGLQFQIDMTREKASNPMAACVKISAMMHDSFGRLREALHEVQGLQAPAVTRTIDRLLSEPEDNHQQSAEVIPFPGN